MNPPEQTDLLVKEYVEQLNAVERIALNVAQTNIHNIFRLPKTAGFKRFLDTRGK